MAEQFKNYIGNITVTDGESIIIVPEAGNQNGAGQTRPANTVAQIHSIYISQRYKENNNRINGTERYNPKNFSAFDLYIEDVNRTTSGDVYKYTYIVYDGRVVPGSPFFIEKNITLEPNQRLKIKCPNNENINESGIAKDVDLKNNDSNAQLNINSNFKLDITASSVLFETA